jgi:hypothetical protein
VEYRRLTHVGTGFAKQGHAQASADGISATAGTKPRGSPTALAPPIDKGCREPFTRQR